MARKTTISSLRLKFLTLQLCVLMCLLGAGAYSQSVASIQGNVISLEGPVEFAGVILFNRKDSTAVKLNTTDSLGRYEFEAIPYGSYFIKVTFVGYNSAFSNVISVHEPICKVPEIRLNGARTILNEVQVTGQKSLIERSAEGTTINVNALVTAAGGNALDVLEKSPGIVLDKNGNIILNGKKGVSVYIDDKPSYLNGSELANFLRNLSSNQLDQIQIITNPSAKYDAAGNGIINIKTKKVLLKGLSSTIVSSYIQGKHPGTTHNFNINYRNRKITLSGGLDYGLRKGFQDFFIQRMPNKNGLSTLLALPNYNQSIYLRTTSQTFGSQANVNYAVNKNTSIGAAVSVLHNPSDAIITNRSEIEQESEHTFVRANGRQEGRWDKFASDLFIRHLFDSTGKVLTLDFNLLHYGSTLDQQFNNFYYDTSDTEVGSPNIFKQGYSRDVTIYGVKSDFIIPVRDKSKLEMGLKFNYAYSDNISTFFNQNNNSNEWIKNDSISNHFLYKENINAAYINYSHKSDKWEIQVGLRAEQTIMNGNQLSTNQTFTRTYNQLFPSVFVACKITAGQTLSIGYGRRIERPSYTDLNPFRLYLDQFTYEEGNPYLKPQLTQNIEISHTLGGTLTTTLFYNKTDRRIQDVMQQNASLSAAFERPENLSSAELTGINMSMDVSPADNLITSTIFLQLINTRVDGLINALPFNVNITTFSGNMLHQMHVGKNWTIELAGMYSSESFSDSFIRKPFGMVSVGISRNILNGKGAVRLSGTDLFWFNKYEGSCQYQDVNIVLRNQWQSQMVRLSFRYQFNKGLKIGQQHIRTNEEAKRIDVD